MRGASATIPSVTLAITKKCVFYLWNSSIYGTHSQLSIWSNLNVE
jgi:hypothetical protein